MTKTNKNKYSKNKNNSNIRIVIYEDSHEHFLNFNHHKNHYSNGQKPTDALKMTYYKRTYNPNFTFIL